MKKALALLLAFTMALSLVACGGTEAPASGSTSQTETSNSQTGFEKPHSDAPIAELHSLAGKEYGADYISLYEQFGKDTTIADVIEDEETGTAYIERDGKRYTLGMDFLSRAMIHNCAVPENGDWETESDVYADWWRLYITRWNQMAPEVPLYSNEYYNIYNAQIKGVEEFPTNPFWSDSRALIDWKSEKADNSIILGDITDLSGKFRFSFFGGNNPGAADRSVSDLINGLGTVEQTIEGEYVWNPTVVAEHTETTNEDGSLTYTIKLCDDLKFSDGTPITAKHYLVDLLTFSSPVGAQAAKKSHDLGMKYVGFESFKNYAGPGTPAEIELKDENGKTVVDAQGNPKTVKTSKEFKGIRLIDDLTFSLTVDASYLPDYYAILSASANPTPTGLYLNTSDIKDDGNGVYLTDDFYAKSGDKYTLASHIEKGAWNTDTTYPYSGMYTIEKWNPADKSCTLVLNPEYKGDYRGHKPSIQKVVYKKIVSATQLEDMKSGGIDVLSQVTGGDETNEALKLVKDQPEKFISTHYARAGYGKLQFRADFGPVQFPAVRQAITYCMDRAKFAKDFTGGYGGIVDGPYYSGAWMYKEAVKDGMMLNAYATSVDTAMKLLEEDGWVYDKAGNAYSGSGVRYKKIPAAEMDPRDITFQSKDGTYKTEKVGDDYLMPLVLNWYGTTNNPVSDLLMTGFLENPLLKQAGFEIQNTIGDFNPMLDELYQAPVTGSYGGVPMYTCFNLATGFYPRYDMDMNWTIDPAEYDDWNGYYCKDTADAYWLQ